METNATLKLVKATSKKGNPYYAIVLDLGHRKVFLSSAKDRTEYLIAEMLGKSVLDVINHENFEIEVK